MTSDQSEPYAVTTIRDLMDGLTELAGMLPEGYETHVELGVCDGEDLQLIENVDLGHWALTPPEGPQIASWFVLLRGHVHPGERRASCFAARRVISTRSCASLLTTPTMVRTMTTKAVTNGRTLDADGERTAANRLD